MTSTASGIAAALWLGALWYAAPLLRASGAASRDATAARMRDGIALGVAIPLGLAAVSLLYAGSCVAVLTLIVVVRSIVRPPRFSPPAIVFSPWRIVAAGADLAGIALPAVAVVAVSWPQIARPLMQGDSIAYHLPNAAAWSVTHTLWTSGTWYWWYPGGSECFAAGLFSVAGPSAVALAGFVALLLLAERLASFARRAGFSHAVAGAFAAAVATIGPIALQGGSLENDVWLAAWTLELAWVLLEERPASARTLAVTSLIKPYGVLFAALAAVTGRASLRAAALGIAPFALWVLRDAILWPHAAIDPGALASPHLERTTIAAHGLTGLRTLGAALWLTGPGIILATIAVVATVAGGRARGVRGLTLGTALFFLFEPYGFRDDPARLASESLRFMAPALALGMVGLLDLLAPFALPFGVGCIALTAYQIATTTTIFFIDPITRGWYVAALILAAAIAIDAARMRGVASAVAALALVAYAVRLPATDTVGYYDDAVSHGAQRSTFFPWLAANRPPVVVDDQLLAGWIAMISPATLVQNTVGVDPCGEARRAHALLVVADDPRTNAAAFAARRAAGFGCGTRRYDDGIILVVDPATPR